MPNLERYSTTSPDLAAGLCHNAFMTGLAAYLATPSMKRILAYVPPAAGLTGAGGTAVPPAVPDLELALELLLIEEEANDPVPDL